jgi:azurin
MNKLVKFLGMFALVCGFASSVQAESEACVIDVDSTDSMRFDSNKITVSKSCPSITVNLSHSGKLPKNIMGHNWVLTKTSDARLVASDGVGAGLDNHYIKPDDARVIVSTAVIGGGEKTSANFSGSVLDPNEKYTFFCSFPGHIGLMIGTLIVTD